jgi:hypothetical protein
MKLIEIAPGISVNPDKVVAVRKENKWEVYKDEQGIHKQRQSTTLFDVCVYTQDVYEKSSEDAVKYLLSAHPYEETIRMLQEEKK